MEIRVYVEGGGNSANGLAEFRRALKDFFLAALPGPKSQTDIHVVACGSRGRTLKDVKLAVESHPNAFVIMLVDAEEAVDSSPEDHLQKHDHWKLHVVAPGQCHLMVTIMESWFLADRRALQTFFGRGFNEKALPGDSKVEDIPKPDVLMGLKNATTKSRAGEYGKMKHGPNVLKIIDPKKVRAAAPHCERLFQVIEAKLSS